MALNRDFTVTGLAKGGSSPTIYIVDVIVRGITLTRVYVKLDI